MIVVRCLQKPIDLRYASADALAEDLRAYLADERVSARSGRFSQVVARVFRETHHAQVLENWGLLWMWHSLALLVACLLTWQLDYWGVTRRTVYAAVWTSGWVPGRRCFGNCGSGWARSPLSNDKSPTSGVPA